MAHRGTQARRFPRYDTSTDVIVYLGPAPIQCSIAQIGRGGCLIFPPLPPRQYEDIKLSFRLSEELPPITCNGHMVYSMSDRGTGVAFTEISLYNQELITSYYESKPTTGKSKHA